ncbi:hypothetical protein G9G54_09370 [Paenibacillus sp. EKM212P]|uniref:hypothetical protein n=1 Tax=Paenibacillus sp. EKM212P TaxID=1683680 RepID=UPI0013EDB0F5|nr:hypothetical protein [Paenibacillus sp. EKM212P]KAF6578932.1 hypothetical protein G9G54_09370 [Paenibacillus sp. EKM212P]
MPVIIGKICCRNIQNFKSISKNIIKGEIPIDNNVLKLFTDNNVSSLKVNNKSLPIYRIDPQGIIHLNSRIAKENGNSIFKMR